MTDWCLQGGRHQQGQPGHNQPDSAHLQRSASGVVGHNQRGGFPSMGGGLGGVTSIGGAAIGGQLSVGPNRQIGGGMHSNQAAGRSSMLGHPSGQMPNPHSVGANSSSGNGQYTHGLTSCSSLPLPLPLPLPLSASACLCLYLCLCLCLCLPLSLTVPLSFFRLFLAH